MARHRWPEQASLRPPGSCTLNTRPKGYPLGQVARAHHQLLAEWLEHHNQQPELGCETLDSKWVTHVMDRMSRPSTKGSRGGSVRGPLSFTRAAGTNSIRKSQGDHAKAVSTPTARVIAVFHIKEENLVKRKKCKGMGETSSFPIMTSTVALIFFALCCN